MSTRINLFQRVPDLINAFSAASQAAHNSGLDSTLKNLVDIRASQLNSCAFCLDMHIKQARILGERELRLHHVAIWRESPLFTAKEKAALALTEALTRPGAEGVSDAIYDAAREHFDEVALSQLAFAISIINTWNRLMIVSKTAPGALDKAYGLDRANLE